MASAQSFCFCSQSCIRSRKCLIKCQGEKFANVEEGKCGKRNLRILIAGGGIGGLVLALAAKQRGYEVKVFEKDLSAVRGEGRERGPIQLLSGALAVLKAIDENVANQIMEAGCVTGNRTNGFAHGLTGEWFLKFDLFTPASKKGLPITLVINRMTLQDILVKAVGSNILINKSKVVDFMQEPSKVTVVLENGQHYDGNILIGADGIWSQEFKALWEARSNLFWLHMLQWISRLCAPIYQYHWVSYFVAVDVGNGKMQWCAFHGEPPSSTNFPGGKKKRLMNLFGNWCNEVITLISETPENMILQRDIYDRDMINKWGIGRVTLLGDAAHPMQPNLGQGGCMAIEDCYQLILELDEVAKHNFDVGKSDEVISALRRYEKKRMARVKIAHTASRMAPRMLAYYQPYIEFNFGPLVM